MRRILTVIVFFIVFLLIYFIQTNFFSWYNIAGIKPNLFIIITLITGLFLGKVYGFSVGITYGICLDLLIGKRIGINAIMLGVSGLIGGILDKNFSKDSRIQLMIMSLVVTLISEIVFYSIQIVILNAEQEILKLMQIISIEAVYNAILIIIFYPLIYMVGNKIDEMQTESISKSLMRYY